MTATLARRIAAAATHPEAAVVNVIALDRLRCERQRLRRGETLVRAGDKFHMLYVIRRGVLKTFATSVDGLIHVTGFPMAGEMVGLSGIGAGIHRNNVVALEDAEMFTLPFARVEHWAQQSGPAQALLMRTLAHEILRSQDLMFMLGAMRAEQRLALFLLDLSVRYQRQGMSRSRFILRMTRQDIGSHLGLQLETVSRSLSRFHCAGYVQVQGKSIALLDFPALWRLSGTSPDNQRTALDPIIDGDGCFQVAAQVQDAIGSYHWQ
jgi:CRP/FNR family transcriptional regulator